MSQRASCWDHAVAESLFSSLKRKRVKKRIHADRESATLDLADYIDDFYNKVRRHSYLGGLSPNAFEAANRRRKSAVY